MEGKKHNGWHDPRVTYPKKDIEVYKGIYVIDTSQCHPLELRALLFHKGTDKLKNSYEMMTYLVKKEPRAEEMINTDTDEVFYTPALKKFIISIEPEQIICLPEEGLAKKVAEEFHDSMKGMLKDSNEVYKHMLRQMIKAK